MRMLFCQINHDFRFIEGSSASTALENVRVL